MVHLKVSVENAQEVNHVLRAFGNSISERLENFLKREGAIMEAELKQSLSISAKMSTTDRRGKNIAVKGPQGGKRWIPSAPGQPPHLRTGNLRAAQGYKVVVNKVTGDFIMDIGGVRGGKREVKYQQGLELGTSTTAPRPHVMPIVQKHIAKWPGFLKVEIDGAAGSSGMGKL